MTSILLIDDDDQLRMILRSVLEGEGFIVREASDGAAGLESYRWQQADLVLCDVFMPGMEGLETIRELRRQFPQAKVVAMSGGSHKTGPATFLTLAKCFGAAGTLEKPFGNSTLLRAVQEALHGSESDWVCV